MQPTERNHIRKYSRSLGALAEERFDVVVIGGGIAGACAAWDAASRGLNVALIERTDFCSGVSGRSPRIDLGGIADLPRLDIPGLRDKSRERSNFLRMAPHLVEPMRFVVPTHGYGMRGRAAFEAALALVRLLTFDRNRGLRDPDRRLPVGGMLTREDVLERFPDIDSPVLTGAALFYDALLHSPPRLVLSIIRSAIVAGATATNYCEANGLFVERGKLQGVRIRDTLTGDRLLLRTRVVVNTAGPHAEMLPTPYGLPPEQQHPLGRDLAVVVARDLVGDMALAVQTRHKDADAAVAGRNRRLFMVPWRGYTLIGANSSTCAGKADRAPPTEAEVQTFLDEINDARPALRLTLDDVTIANGCPLQSADNLAYGTSQKAGKRVVVVDHSRDGGPRELVTVLSAGWTTARSAGEIATDLAFRKLGHKPPPSRIASTSVYGGDIDTMVSFTTAAIAERPAEISDESIRHLLRFYGTAWKEILTRADTWPELYTTLGGTPVLAAEVDYAVTVEMAQTLADVILRRTDLGTAGHPAEVTVQACAALMAKRLGWDASRVQTEIANLKAHYPVWQQSPDSHRLAQNF
jgi:glycerol-3-phosphate dehydrogenase